MISLAMDRIGGVNADVWAVWVAIGDWQNNISNGVTTRERQHVGYMCNEKVAVSHTRHHAPHRPEKNEV